MKELLTGSTTRRHCGQSPSWPPWGSASELLRWPSTCGSCSPCLYSTGIGGLALKLCLLIGQYYNHTHHVIEDNVLEVLLTVSIYTGHPLQSPDWILQILNPVLIIMNNTIQYDIINTLITWYFSSLTDMFSCNSLKLESDWYWSCLNSLISTSFLAISWR